MKKIFHAGNVIIAGFVVFALLLLTLVFKAINSDVQMSVEGDYYAQEVHYNDLMMAKKNAAQLGDDFTILNEGDNIIVQLANPYWNKMENGEVSFFSYINGDMDKTVRIDNSTSGYYVFNKSTLNMLNNYIVKVSFEMDHQHYYKELIVK